MSKAQQMPLSQYPALTGSWYTEIQNIM